MLFKKILHLANKHLFFNPIVCSSTKNILGYHFGASGTLLQENIKAEWIYSNVTNRDLNVFFHSSNGYVGEREDISKIYLNIRDLCSKRLSFGVAEIYNERNKTVHSIPTTNLLENTYFSCPLNTICSSTVFLPPSEGTHFFFHWQRQRKLWWKKISAFPGRFFLGEISNTPNTTVDILAKFPWGDQVLETVSIVSMDKTGDIDFTARHGRKDVIPTMVNSKLKLESAVVALLCDAFDEDSIHNSPVLRLHRKLSPYKCIMAASSPDTSRLEELSQLAFYLTKQFRKAGISTILLPDCSMSPLQDQFLRNDEWGIPYTIVLDDTSLKSGLVSLRSRDTTLSETVHISDLPTYILQIFKNF